MSPFDPLTQTRPRTKLARLRMEGGATQREMWEAVGVSRATYLRLEHGKTINPPLRLLVNCAIALGCQLDELIEDPWREWYTPKGYVQTGPVRVGKG